MSKFQTEFKGYNKEFVKFHVLPFIYIENDKFAFSISLGWLFWKVIFFKYKKKMKAHKKVSKTYISQVKNLFEK